MYGWIHSNLLVEKVPYEKAYYNLYIDTDNPKHKYMKYRIHFKSKLSKDDYTFYGFKEVKKIIHYVSCGKIRLFSILQIYKGYTEREG